jgi:hypothetical protein
MSTCCFVRLSTRGCRPDCRGSASVSRCPTFHGAGGGERLRRHHLIPRPVVAAQRLRPVPHRGETIPAELCAQASNSVCPHRSVHFGVAVAADSSFRNAWNLARMGNVLRPVFKTTVKQIFERAPAAAVPTTDSRGRDNVEAHRPHCPMRDDRGNRLLRSLREGPLHMRPSTARRAGQSGHRRIRHHQRPTVHLGSESFRLKMIKTETGTNFSISAIQTESRPPIKLIGKSGKIFI